MAEKRSERMAVVLMVAERKEQQAAGYLREHRDRVEAERQQLDQLTEYREGYLAQFSRQQSAMAAEQLSRYSQFIHHLAGVIEQQRQQLQTLEQQLEKLRQHWHEQHRRRRAVEDLIERLKAGEDRHAEKRLQKELDAIANARPPTDG